MEGSLVAGAHQNGMAHYLGAPVSDSTISDGTILHNMGNLYEMV
jgi:hypothetical protein